MKRLLYLLSVCYIIMFISVPTALFAQNDSGIEMANTLRGNGKIYVVVLVICIVFTGLILFAINSDRKISKLEKEIKSLKSREDL